MERLKIMGRNQHKEDAGELWAYLGVIDWVKKYSHISQRNESRPWGDLYNEYKRSKI